MNTSILKIILLVFLFGFCSAQELTKKEIHDRATENIGDVVFKTKSVSDKIKLFENGMGVKVQFRVDDQSLDQLGGLSEHLFKLFQNFTSSENVNVKTITGEFSAIQNNVLSEILTYKTNATSDLTKCVLPGDAIQKLDSTYNLALKVGLMTTGDFNSAPVTLDEFCGQSVYDYQDILLKNSECPGIFDADSYNQHVKNTRQNRANSWNGDISALSLNVSANFGLLSTHFPLTANQNNGSTGVVSLSVTGDPAKGKHIINLNNSVNTCTEEDMEVRCRMLFKKTNKRFLFVTQDLNYYLPLDSLTKFKDGVAQTFSNTSTDEVIIALYLKMKDGANSLGVLLVKQVNGDWLTNADINFANYNNAGNYKPATFYKFKTLFKNIPKPLVICYQVAKVNGALTTTYFNKGTVVKGREQMYYHVFKIDKAFDELKQLDDQLSNAYLLSPNIQGNYKARLIEEITTKIKIAYLKAAKKPEFNECEQHFKEIYLQKENVVVASALKYIQDKYGLLYSNNQFSQLIANVGPPDDLYAGTCKENNTSDAVGDALGLTSLLLTPFALDFIADALSVAYFAGTDQTLNMILASASFVTPGNLCAAKSLVGNSADVISNINKGNKLLVEAGQLKAIHQDVNQITGMFHLKPSDVDVSLVNKINQNPTTTENLLPITLEQAKIYTNTEKLPAPKRIEFIKKCYDDAEFRTKCLNDPDEVLRWGGVYFTRIDNYVIEVTKVNLPSSIASTFENSGYRTVLTNQNVNLYRTFGNQARLNGGFATTAANVSRNELALLDEWDNNMRFEAIIQVPQGQNLNIGRVAPQTSSNNLQTLTGGGDQILLPQNWNYQIWVKKVKDKETGMEYSFQEFQKLFPNVITN